MPRRAFSLRREMTVVLEDIVNNCLEEGIPLYCPRGLQFINLNQPIDLKRCWGLDLL